MTDSPTPERAPVFGDLAIRTLVVPFVVYLIALTVAGSLDGVPYPVGYSAAIAVTVLSMAVTWRGYLRAPFSVSALSVAVGIVGVVVWIGLWMLDREFLGLGSLVGIEREGFNPFEALGATPVWMWAFLSVRFLGLVVIVPVIEELFVRGFLMRYVDSTKWETLPLGHATRMSVGAVVIYAVLSHPGEALAAVVWFSLVTWLYVRTRSIWDCVVAHAVTNLLLGLYVIGTGTWELW
jgi:CAAX protease family protein